MQLLWHAEFKILACSKKMCEDARQPFNVICSKLIQFLGYPKLGCHGEKTSTRDPSRKVVIIDQYMLIVHGDELLNRGIQMMSC